MRAELGSPMTAVRPLPAREALRARDLLMWGAACVALAAVTLLLAWRPTYDPWAWLVFGRELAGPLPFSTLAHTGWKPLPVLFTAPFGLADGAAPLLWLLLARAAGLAALALAFRLAWRAGGWLAGTIAVLALALSEQWLRYLAAGNIEPVCAALLLGAGEAHLSGRRRLALGLGLLVGLARPEIWPLVGLYALWLWRADGSRWPTLVGLPALVGLWLGPDWAGSGEFLHIFGSASGSEEPAEILSTSQPALTLAGRALEILMAPVWIASLAGVVYGWRTRDRTTLTVAVLALSWTTITIAGEAIGYPAVPRYLVPPAAAFCVLAGIGFVALTRAIAAPRRRAVLVVLVAVMCVPFVAARSVDLADQVRSADRRAEQLAQLFQAVDRADVAQLGDGVRPLVVPDYYSTALAWKLNVTLDQVSERPSRRVDIVFALDDAPDLIRLRRRGLRLEPIARAGEWRVLRIRRRPAGLALSTSRMLAAGEF